MEIVIALLVLNIVVLICNVALLSDTKRIINTKEKAFEEIDELLSACEKELDKLKQLNGSKK